MTSYVYEFSEGDKDQKDLLGGRGANLAEMTNLGLPVPPGFTITTVACREYLREGRESGALRVRVTTALRHLEDSTGRRQGDRHDTLLVSVRSRAEFHCFPEVGPDDVSCSPFRVPVARLEAGRAAVMA